MSIVTDPQLSVARPVCRWLNYVDVMDCEELQDRVVQGLTPDEQRLFFYPRPNEFRDNALANGDAVVGCFQDDQLVGQAILLRNSTGDRFVSNYLLERPVPFILQNRSSAVITNAMVDPALHGQGVMQAILEYVSGGLRTFGVDAAFFITHIRNKAMIVAGLRSGYRIMDVGICRNNDEPMYLMVRQPMLNAVCVKRSIAVNIAHGDYAEAQHYLEDGWIGNALDGDELLLQAA